MLDSTTERLFFSMSKNQEEKILGGLSHCALSAVSCGEDSLYIPEAADTPCGATLSWAREHEFMLLSWSTLNYKAAFAGLDASFTSCYSPPYMSGKKITFVATDNLWKVENFANKKVFFPFFGGHIMLPSSS